MIDISELTDDDFPEIYKNFAHPSDYQVTNEPILPECVYHKKYGFYCRLVFRTSLDLGNHHYTTLSFICDTGAAKFLYLTPKALDLLNRFKVLNVDDETDTLWLLVAERKVPVEPAPLHVPVNIIGLQLLSRLGLRLRENEFFFDNAPNVF